MSTNTPAPVETGDYGLQLQNIDEMWRFATMVAKSNLAPKSLSRPEQIIVALQHGMEVGLKPLQALNSIAVINGKPSIYGDAGTALVMASGKLVKKNESVDGTGDAMTARCVLWRKGMDEPFVGTFSVAQAKLAQLWGKAGPWKSYPERMLMWRARTYAYRDGFADCLCGLTFAEEARDIVVEPNAREAKEIDLDGLLVAPKAEPQGFPFDAETGEIPDAVIEAAALASVETEEEETGSTQPLIEF